MPTNPPSPSQQAYDQAEQEFGEATVLETQQCDATQPADIRVTVRRDFPLRRGEEQGNWLWSSKDEAGSTVRQRDPQVWEFTGPAIPPPNQDLPTEGDRDVYGYGIGRDTGGGVFTTTHDENIEGVVELRQAGAIISSGTMSGTDGEVVLNTSGLTGSFQVRVRPRHVNDSDFAGALFRSAIINPVPDAPPQEQRTLADLEQANFVYRSLEVDIELSCGRITRVEDPYDPPAILRSSIGATHGRVGNAVQQEPQSTHLPISLKPIWWIHPADDSRITPLRGTQNPGSRTYTDGRLDIDLVVLHCTGGPRVGPAVNHWKEAWRDRKKKTKNAAGEEVVELQDGIKTGAGYILDHDGHMIKLALDTTVIGSVGGNHYWLDPDPASPANSNARSIAVEIINANKAAPSPPYILTNGPFFYSQEQYKALEIFLSQTKSEYPGIVRDPNFDRIIGHSDIQAQGKRRFDPGKRFEWEHLEKLGIGIRPYLDPSDATASSVHSEVSNTIYDGVYQTEGLAQLQFGDRDPQPGRHAKLGGDLRRGYTHTPIARIRSDLRRIGYYLPSSPAEFDANLRKAINKFNRHFFSNGRLHHLGITPAKRDRIPDRAIPLLVAKRLRQVAGSPDEYEFWLRHETAAIHAYVRGGGVIGVFRTRDDAATDPSHRGIPSDLMNIWQQNWGENHFECWLINPSAAIRAGVLAGRRGQAGVVAVYDDEATANSELSRTVSAGHTARGYIWRKYRY